jgi:hypothetical protein
MLMVGLFGLTGVAAVRTGAEPRDRTNYDWRSDERTRVASPAVDDRDDGYVGVSSTGTAAPASFGWSPPSGTSLSARPFVPRVAPSLYRNHSAAYWAWRFRVRTEQLQAARAQVRRRWHPTVDYALRLASAVAGVSYWQLREVSWCESTHNPFATNGRYKGIFQLGWSPFGFSPYDPVANALSAALTVRREGSWRRWTCKP